MVKKIKKNESGARLGVGGIENILVITHIKE